MSTRCQQTGSPRIVCKSVSDLGFDQTAAKENAKANGVASGRHAGDSERHLDAATWMDVVNGLEAPRYYNQHTSKNAGLDCDPHPDGVCPRADRKGKQGYRVRREDHLLREGPVLQGHRLLARGAQGWCVHHIILRFPTSLQNS
eukprot:6020581-Pyramimonas_sp.AAC.1